MQCLVLEEDVSDDDEPNQSERIEVARTSESREIKPGRIGSDDLGRSLDLQAELLEVPSQQLVPQQELRLEGEGEDQITFEIERRRRTSFLDISNVVGIALGLLVFLLILSGENFFIFLIKKLNLFRSYNLINLLYFPFFILCTNQLQRFSRHRHFEATGHLIYVNLKVE